MGVGPDGQVVTQLLADAEVQGSIPRTKYPKAAMQYKTTLAEAKAYDASTAAEATYAAVEASAALEALYAVTAAKFLVQNSSIPFMRHSQSACAPASQLSLRAWLHMLCTLDQHPPHPTHPTSPHPTPYNLTVLCTPQDGVLWWGLLP